MYCGLLFIILAVFILSGFLFLFDIFGAYSLADLFSKIFKIKKKEEYKYTSGYSHRVESENDKPLRYTDYDFDWDMNFDNNSDFSSSDSSSCDCGGD